MNNQQNIEMDNFIQLVRYELDNDIMSYLDYLLKITELKILDVKKSIQEQNEQMNKIDGLVNTGTGTTEQLIKYSELQSSNNLKKLKLDKLRMKKIFLQQKIIDVPKIFSNEPGQLINLEFGIYNELKNTLLWNKALKYLAYCLMVLHSKYFNNQTFLDFLRYSEQTNSLQLGKNNNYESLKQRYYEIIKKKIY